MPTPGQLLTIESNAFTADKFVSKRSSKKWDVPPSDITVTKAASAKTFNVTEVDPSEFVPKVVPLCEVESALGKEGEDSIDLATEQVGAASTEKETEVDDVFQ